jgi:UDP-glucose:tetrahydrobiopterin glucosyltransferase
LKIALLSPFIHPIIEPFAGGTEAFIFHFSRALLQKGVEVVCYACEGSYIPGVEIRTLGVPKDALSYPQASKEMAGDDILIIRAYEDAVMHQAIEDARTDPSIDVLHNHSFSAIPFFLTHLIEMPIIHTLHLPPMLPNMTHALNFCKSSHIALPIVAISQQQARLWQPYYPVSTVITNGIDIETLPFSPVHDGTLAFVGRIDPDKGLEDAISVAALSGKQLAIYGEPQPYNCTYFKTSIEPLLSMHPNIIYHGLVTQQRLFQAISQAQALIFPIKWDEPFGNVIVESMAVGTPVVMYDRGSASELITNGLNGAIVTPDDVAGLATAIAQVATLDRSACSLYARTHFDMTTCAENYLAFIQTINRVLIS